MLCSRLTDCSLLRLLLQGGGEAAQSCCAAWQTPSRESKAAWAGRARRPCLRLALVVEVGVLGAALGGAEPVDHVHHPVGFVLRAEQAALLSGEVEVSPGTTRTGILRACEAWACLPNVSIVGTNTGDVPQSTGIRWVSSKGAGHQCFPILCTANTQPQRLWSVQLSKHSGDHPRDFANSIGRCWDPSAGYPGPHHVRHSGKLQRLFMPTMSAVQEGPRPSQHSARRQRQLAVGRISRHSL